MSLRCYIYYSFLIFSVRDQIIQESLQLIEYYFINNLLIAYDIYLNMIKQ